MIIDGSVCACGKFGYGKRTAEQKANFIRKTGRGRHMRIYQCNDSDMWHLSNGDRAHDEKYKRGGYTL